MNRELPQTCAFCGEEITKRGKGPDSLLIHSLDGNHENMDPANKVPLHRKCHGKYHAKFHVLTISGYTTAQVKESTWSRIKDHKKLGESNDDVVSRAFDALDREDKTDE